MHWGVPLRESVGASYNFFCIISYVDSAYNSYLFLYADDSALSVSHSDRVMVGKCLSAVVENIVFLVDKKLPMHRNVPDFEIAVQGFVIAAKSTANWVVLDCVVR